MDSGFRRKSRKTWVDLNGTRYKHGALSALADRHWPPSCLVRRGRPLIRSTLESPGTSRDLYGQSFAVCLVEMLVHANRKSPPSAARFVEAVVPDDVSREELDRLSLPGWDDPRDTSVAQTFGRAWIESRRSALLFVPSGVTAGHDMNVVVNPDHPDTTRISVGPETAVALDRRFFGP